MKKIVFAFTFFISVTFLSATAFAQKAAYIIPDIGAPGTNVYIELIAHIDSIGAFGTKSFIDDSSFVLKPIENADLWKIQFSPLFVSWTGRLITTHAFIHPSLEPNSFRWNELNADFHIPIGLFEKKENGEFELVKAFDFYVVLPWPLGDVSGFADTVLGEGNLGRRSPRGAMIVDSLILGNKKYTVSTVDRDPNEGEQGYLPFTLTAIGDIRGGAGTVISVDAGTVRNNGGPGGGGGGGGVVDKPTSRNSNHWDLKGGDGFTGGGIGGMNNSGLPLTSNEWSSRGGGVGSGSNDRSGLSAYGNRAGYSLNGVPGALRVGYEAAGGGTGHPFGKSGEGSYGGDGDNRAGGYGAGSGGGQQRAGGNGAYLTSGGTRNRDGKVIGNSWIIPLAGGSGGASGNPQAVGAYSGYGGGGGGAIAINAKNITSISISAKGADGQQGYTAGGDGNGPGGGSGSGGGIVATSKLSTNINSFNVDGGQRGNFNAGSGGFRSDAFNVPVGSPATVGLVTDTAQYFDDNDSILIKGYSGTREIDFYMKTEKGAWHYVHNLNNTSGVLGSWSQAFTLNDVKNLLDDYEDGDTIIYFFTVGYGHTPSNDNYTAVPQYILSQGAANILRIKIQEPEPIPNEEPSIELVRNLPIPVIPLCDKDSIVTFEIQKIRNVGEGKFEITNMTSSQLLHHWCPFDADSPVIVVAPISDEERPDTMTVSIMYKIPANTNSGVYRDTITIWHNDTANNPWKIPFAVTIQRLELVMQPAAPINLGTMLIGATVSFEATFSIFNNTDFPIDFSNIICNSSSLNYVFDPSSGTVPPHNFLEINITYTEKSDATIGTKSDEIIIITECGAEIRNQINYILAEDDNVEIKPNPRYLESITNCGEIIFPTSWTNGLEYILTVTKIESYGPDQDLFDFSDFSIDIESLPMVLAIGEKIDWTVSTNNLTGEPLGIKEVYLDFHTTNPSGEKEIYRFIYTMEIVEALAATPNPLNFGTINAGTTEIEVTTLTYLPTYAPASVDTAYLTNETVFSIRNPSQLNDYTFAIYGSIGSIYSVQISCFSTVAGDFRDTLVVVLQNAHCYDTMKIPILVTILPTDTPITPMDISLGKITLCDERKETLRIPVATASFTVNNILPVSGIDRDLFRWEHNYDLPRTFAIGETFEIDLIATSALTTTVGSKTATFDILILSETGMSSIIRVNLTVEVVPGIVTVPATLINYGTVAIGDDSTAIVELVNQGEINIRIKQAYLRFGDNFVLGNNVDGVTVNGFGKDSVRVTAKPTVEGNLVDTLIVVVAYPLCEGTLRIPLRVAGEETEITPALIEIIASKHPLVKPTSTNYAIPIYILSTEDIDIQEIESLLVAINKTIFYPRSLIWHASNTTTTLPINHHQEFVEINLGMVQVSPLKAGDTTLLVTIIGDVLLGEQIFSDIIIKDVRFSDKNIEPIKTDGYISLDICESGGGRLLNYDYETSVSVIVNPVSTVLDVKCSVIEVGEYRLEIVDLNGHSKVVKSWKVAFSDDNLHFEFSIPVLEYSNGSYFIMLHTPTAIFNEKFIIAR